MGRVVIRPGLPANRLTFNESQAAASVTLLNKPSIQQGQNIQQTGQGNPTAIYVKSQELGRYILVSQNQPLNQTVNTPYGNVQLQFTPVFNNGQVSLAPKIIGNQTFSQTSSNQQGNIGVNQTGQFTFAIQGNQLVGIPVGQTSGSVVYQDQAALSNISNAQNQISYLQGLIGKINTGSYVVYNADKTVNPTATQNALNAINAQLNPPGGINGGYSPLAYYQNQLQLAQAQSAPITLATIANGIISPTNATISQPIYGNVNNTNQLLGNVVLSPVLASGGLSLQPSGFQPQAVQLSGKGYYASVNPTFNLATGTISINPANYNYVVGNVQNLNLPSITIGGQTVAGGTEQFISVPAAFNAPGLNYLAYQNVPVGVSGITRLSPTILYQNYSSTGGYSRSLLTPASISIQSIGTMGSNLNTTFAFNVNPASGTYSIIPSAVGTSPVTINGKTIAGLSELYNSSTGYSLSSSTATTPLGLINLAIDPKTGLITASLASGATSPNGQGININLTGVVSNATGKTSAPNFTSKTLATSGIGLGDLSGTLGGQAQPMSLLGTSFKGFQGADVSNSGVPQIKIPAVVSVTSTSKPTAAGVLLSLVYPKAVTEPVTFTVKTGGNSLLTPATVSSYTENLTPLQAIGQKFVIQQNTLAGMGETSPLTALTNIGTSQGNLGYLLYSPTSTPLQRAEALGIIGVIALPVAITGGALAPTLTESGALIPSTIVSTFGRTLGGSLVFGGTSALTGAAVTVPYSLIFTGKLPSLKTVVESGAISGAAAFLTYGAAEFLLAPKVTNVEVRTLTGLKPESEVVNLKTIVSDENLQNIATQLQGTASRTETIDINGMPAGKSVTILQYNSRLGQLFGLQPKYYVSVEPISYAGYSSGNAGLGVSKDLFGKTSVSVSQGNDEVITFGQAQSNRLFAGVKTDEFANLKGTTFSFASGEGSEQSITFGESPTASLMKVNVGDITTTGQGAQFNIPIKGTNPLGITEVTVSGGFGEVVTEEGQIIPLRFQTLSANINKVPTVNIGESLSENPISGLPKTDLVAINTAAKSAVSNFNLGLPSSGDASLSVADIDPSIAITQISKGGTVTQSLFGSAITKTSQVQVEEPVYIAGNLAQVQRTGLLVAERSLSPSMIELAPAVVSGASSIAQINSLLNQRVSKTAPLTALISSNPNLLKTNPTSTTSQRLKPVSINAQGTALESPQKAATSQFNPLQQIQAQQQRSAQQQTHQQTTPTAPPPSPPPDIPFKIPGIIIPGLGKIKPQERILAAPSQKFNISFKYIPDLASASLGITREARGGINPFEKLGVFRPLIKGKGKRK